MGIAYLAAQTSGLLLPRLFARKVNLSQKEERSQSLASVVVCFLGRFLSRIMSNNLVVTPLKRRRCDQSLLAHFFVVSIFGRHTLRSKAR